MPYSHFHNWSYHTHHRRPKGGNHYRAIRRHQRPWRIGATIAMTLTVMAGVVWVGAWLNMEGLTSGKWTDVELPPSSSIRVATATPLSEIVFPSAAAPAPPVVQVQPTLTKIQYTPTPSVVAATVAPERTPTLTPTSTPIPPPHRRYIAEKQYMLELINEARENADVPAVELGDNIAAQLHAESANENCFSSHWGMDGLTPYMRYSLAGGYQANGENSLGSNYCIDSDEYEEIERRHVKAWFQAWMRSPGHRGNILDPTHRKVNIGLAWDGVHVSAYQHFEGDYVTYNELPSISADGVLSVSGTLKNGATFGNARDLTVGIDYDPPPHKLTRGQLARSYAYNYGRPVASLREPLTGDWSWTEDQYIISYNPSPNPYDVPPDAPVFQSYDDEDRDLLAQASEGEEGRKQHREIVVPWVTASKWKVGPTSFSVEADIEDVLDEHGPGVYSVVVWGEINGEGNTLSHYAIFYGIEPPDTYTP